MPNESHSKYSFDDDNKFTENSAERSGNNLVRTNYPIQEENESQEDTSRHGEPTAKPQQEELARTRAYPYERPERFPGNYPEYSEQSPSPSPPSKPSDELSSKKFMEREQLKEFIKQNEQYLANAERQRRVVYKDTNNENSRDQQNSSEPSSDQKKLVDRFVRSAKEQETRRPQLSNVCQEREPHSDLDYSHDSEHEE